MQTVSLENTESKVGYNDVTVRPWSSPGERVCKFTKEFGDRQPRTNVREPWATWTCLTFVRHARLGVAMF